MNSFKIKNVKIKSNVVLAPMAGFSDVGLRALANSYGAGLTYTEMVSAKALEYNNAKTYELLATTENEKPVAVQIFGSDPECMALACKNPALQKFDIIDINMGCPTPKIVKNGDGSALLKNINLAEKIIRACVAATDKPITVKFRVGWMQENIIAVEFAKMCERAGASAITVHGRTVEQGYSGKSNLNIIKEVVNSVNIPVIASGDCVDAESYKNILEKTGATAVMIGRAAIGCPEIFAECLGNSAIVDKLNQITEHINILRRFYDDKLIALTMRGVACHYLKGIEGTSALKVEISKSQNIEEILKLLTNFFKKS